MAQLLGPNGKPISSEIVNKKAAPPKLGEAFGNWAGRDVEYLTLPGGGVVQFDLSKLTLADFRAMRDHYQVNASLAVLSFMQHQSDFHVVHEDKKIAEHCEENLREIWTGLNRGMSQANWAGYSPNILQWENDANSRTIQLTKIKDLIPEECRVKWDEVDGWSPPGRPAPKYKIFGGISQAGSPYPVPVDNSYWYPLLMENGDYYGKKLLRPAFTSWFFSILVHLFANRYYERFGEPVPVGRAPFEEDITLPDGTNMPGSHYMLKVLADLRNRSVVVLPNDRTQNDRGTSDFDYELQYLESQMRGADFERYMSRLDEEISLALFTPVLLMRTSDVGSYNLGVGHMQMYLWMLNAMNDDRAVYINKYILSRMVDINFSPKAPRAKIVFRKLGNHNAELLKEMITQLISKDKIEPDLRELGQMTGMTLKQIQQTTAKPEEPTADPSKDGEGSEVEPDEASSAPKRGSAPASARAQDVSVSRVVTDICDRVRPQVRNAIAGGRWESGLKLNMGHKNRMASRIGVKEADRLYSFMDLWIADMVGMPMTEEEFMSDFSDTLKKFSAS
jgi:hypothetical protein